MNEKEKLERAMFFHRRVMEGQKDLLRVARELRAIGKPSRELESMFKKSVRDSPWAMFGGAD